jgi:hypothetical protein
VQELPGVTGLGPFQYCPVMTCSVYSTPFLVKVRRVLVAFFRTVLS